jgi:hypothetical protein
MMAAALAASSGRNDEDGDELLVRLARLLATLATEVIDSLKRLENGWSWMEVRPPNGSV